MSTFISVGLDMIIETCWVCGITFGMPRKWSNKRKETGKGFSCPAGCALRYGKSEVDKLREQVEREQKKLQREREWHDRTKRDRDAVERSLSATKGVVTRIKNRIANGVCPCCRRHFANLQGHMETKHPDYVHQEV